MYCTRCGTWAPEAGTACPRCGEPLAAPAAARPETAPRAAAVPAGPRYGGFWRRLWAWLVDGLVLFFPDTILRLTLDLPTPLRTRPSIDGDTHRVIVGFAITTALWWLYCSILESSPMQGTLGQQLLGLKVTDLAGRRVSYLRATGRYFGQFLSSLICGVGYLFNLWTPRRQTLHDMVSGCVLVRPEPEPAPVALAKETV